MRSVSFTRQEPMPGNRTFPRVFSAIGTSVMAASGMSVQSASIPLRMPSAGAEASMKFSPFTIRAPIISNRSAKAASP